MQQIRRFFHPKNADIFLISRRKHMLWSSLEAPRQGTSNEYPQHMFSSRNKKNIMWIPPLICSYDFQSEQCSLSDSNFVSLAIQNAARENTDQYYILHAVAPLVP